MKWAWAALGVVFVLGYLTRTFRYGYHLWRRWRYLPRYEAEMRQRQGLCPRCGYDLTGNVSGICPECGEKRASQ